MAIGCIIYCKILPPKYCINSHCMYEYIRRALGQQEIAVDEKGILNVGNFDVLGNNYRIFNHKIKLEYNVKHLFGKWKKSDNIKVNSIQDSLKTLFDEEKQEF